MRKANSLMIAAVPKISSKTVCTASPPFFFFWWAAAELHRTLSRGFLSQLVTQTHPNYAVIRSPQSVV